MGRERLFRGGREGRDRSFDWYALAKERDISLEQARVLYEEALRRRARESQGPHRNAEAVYLELLEEARQEAWRPSPGKVTRTMRLAAERAGKKQPRSHISPLTGQPIPPGKRTLTSYLEPPARERRPTSRERERLEAIAESFRAMGVAVPPDLQSALARVQHAEPSGMAPRAESMVSDAVSTVAPPAQERSEPETTAHRRLQANLLAAHGHFEELEALEDEEHLEAEFAAGTEVTQSSEVDRGDTADPEVNGWPLPSEWQSLLGQQAREQSTSAWQVHATEGQSETSVGHALWPAEGVLFQAQMVGEEEKFPPLTAVARQPVESWGVAGPIQAAGLQGLPEKPVHLPEHGGGAEIPADVRRKMEAAFGVDFSSVRIHEGPEATSVGALAYTQGPDIHFAPGQYAPGSQQGQELLGHELAHVVQQAQGRVHGTSQAKGVPINDDPTLEREADVLGARAARGDIAQRRSGSRSPVSSSIVGQQTPIQRVQDEQAGGNSADPARAIYQAFHGSLFSEHEEAALAQIRGRSPASLRAIRARYLSRYGVKLEDEFESYCDDGQAAEALSLLWPAIPVVDRLQRNTGLFDDNEDGMMDVLRTATRSELDAAATDPRLQDLLDELSDDQQYQARRLLWPDRTRAHVLWRLARAHGYFNDDEDAVYNVLLDLGPGERRTLWDERDQHLSFLSESELALVRRMCVGEDGGEATEAAALGARMEIATDGLGTDDEAVRLVVGRAASLAQEEDRIRAALDTGVTAEGEPLSDEQRASLQARLAEIGSVRETLLTSERGSDGALAEDSFLGRLEDDVSASEYGALAEAMGSDPYDRAKQNLLDAIDTFNDDEQAIYHAFRDLCAPLILPEGRTTADYSAEELRQMQADATRALRERLRNDPDLAPVWNALNGDEPAVLGDYVAGDTYRIAIHELEEAYRGLGTDEARIVSIVAGMSAEDRARMTEERPPIYVDMMSVGGLVREEIKLVHEVFRTGRIPTERALDVAMGDWGDGTDEQLLLGSLGSMPDEERRVYRLGYWLHKQGRTAGNVEGEAQREALQQFRQLNARMEGELDDEDLDAAMERLIGLPSPEDFLTPEGRSMAAEIMSYRHQDRLTMSGGLTEPFTSTDETAEQAATVYDAHLRQLVQRGGDISLEDFSVLVGLDAAFNQRFGEYQATSELVSNIAGTVAATVAAIIIVVLSKGTLAPAAAKLISTNGGAALWAAVAGAGARVAASEAFGGDFYQAASTEGARDAVVGAIEGAVAVAAASLAARAASLVGLSERALGAEIVSAALDSTESGLAVAGRGFARGALEGAIDGFVSGAVGDLVMTATDVETWRRSVWEILGMLGMSLLRGGAFGLTSGGLAGGMLEGASGLLRRGGNAGSVALENPELSSVLARSPRQMDEIASELGMSELELVHQLRTLRGPAREALLTRVRQVAEARRAGGRASYGNTLDWANAGFNISKLEKLRADLLAKKDIGSVMETLRSFNIEVDSKLVVAVKRYLFDSAGISFNHENYAAWKRLASKNASVRDVQFLLHEVAEVSELQRLQQTKGFDFMGRDLQDMSRRARRQWTTGFDRNYMKAHAHALEAEYDFVAEQVAIYTNRQVEIGRVIAAAVDPDRSEARLYMIVDNRPLNEHYLFNSWQARAQEIVQIGTLARERLGFSHGGTITLSDLVRQVRLRGRPQ